MVRSERADALYTTQFIASMFQHESGGLFEVRSAVLGQVQEGCNPSPFDRIQATRLAKAGVETLIDRAHADHAQSFMVGMREGNVVVTQLGELPNVIDRSARRSQASEWWMAMRPVADAMALAQPESSRPDQ